MDLGPHAVFIWGSYGAFVAVIGSVIVWLVLDGRAHARALADLDARGIKRRADRSEGT